MNWLYWTCNCLCCNGLVLCLSLLRLCFTSVSFVLVYYPFLLIWNTLAVWGGGPSNGPPETHQKLFGDVTYMVLLLLEPKWCFNSEFLCFDQILIELLNVISGEVFVFIWLTKWKRWWVYQKKTPCSWWEVFKDGRQASILKCHDDCFLAHFTILSQYRIRNKLSDIYGISLWLLWNSSEQNYGIHAMPLQICSE